jgi:hypothetical protein
MATTRRPPDDDIGGDHGGSDDGNDLVRTLIQEVVATLQLMQDNSLDNRRTMMEEFVQGRPNPTRDPRQVWRTILGNQNQMIEADYLLLRQGLGRHGRNRLDLSRNDDGVWFLTSDRIVDAIGLAIGTPDGSGQMAWEVVAIDHVLERSWGIERPIFEGGAVTFATFNDHQVTSAWQGSLAPATVPSDYDAVAASRF